MKAERGSTYWCILVFKNAFITICVI